MTVEDRRRDRAQCPMCGNEFSREESTRACAGCSLLGTGGCKKVKCPRCGYEMPAPPRLPGLISGVLRRIGSKQ